MKKIFLAIAIVFSLNAYSAGDRESFIAFARCDGILQSDASSNNFSNLSQKMASGISQDLLKAALLSEPQMSLSEYRDIKITGTKQYINGKSDLMKTKFLVIYCANKALEAMALLEMRGKDH